MISSSTFLPANLKPLPLYQNVTEALDHLISTYDSEIQSLFKKYNSFYDGIDSVAISNIISELGYGYLLNILNLQPTELRTILACISLIHYLKGTRQGLQLIFTLLGIEYELEEWWEQDPQGEPLSASIIVDMNLSKTTYEANSKLQRLTREYVYPKMNFVFTFHFPWNNNLAIAGYIDRIVYGSVDDMSDTLAIIWQDDTYILFEDEEVIYFEGEISEYFSISWDNNNNILFSDNTGVYYG